MDLIDRRDVLDLPRNITKNFFGEVIEETINVEDIKALPSKQPQRMRGRWIESNLVPSRKGKPDGRLFICSECNKGWVKQDRSMKEINFCPNCGADMRGGEQESEIHSDI